MSIRSLEVSSKGDKRFSALYAKVNVSGKYDSIENHYQLSKVFLNKMTGEHCRFGNFKQVKHIQRRDEYKLIGFIVNGKMLDVSYLTGWYKALWLKYFLKNQSLINVIMSYDNFTDMFTSVNTINSQVDICKQIRYKGLSSLKDDCMDFINQLR